MPPTGWCTGERREFINLWMPEYLLKGTAKRLDEFWPKMKEAWFNEFPEEKELDLPVQQFDPDPDVPLPQQLTDEEREIFGKAVAVREKQLKNQFKNGRDAIMRKRGAVNRSATSLAAMLFKKRPKRRRRHQVLEIYQKHYRAQIQAALRKTEYDTLNEAAQCRDEDGEWINDDDDTVKMMRVQGARKRCMMIFRRVVRECFEAEEEVVKEAMREEAKEEIVTTETPDRTQEGEGPERTPEEYQMSIDESRQAAEMFLEEFQRMTGWMGVLVYGGPVPRLGGDFGMKTVAFGTTPGGVAFDVFHPKWKKAVSDPLFKFLRQAIRAPRPGDIHCRRESVEETPARTTNRKKKSKSKATPAQPAPKPAPVRRPRKTKSTPATAPTSTAPLPPSAPAAAVPATPIRGTPPPAATPATARSASCQFVEHTLLRAATTRGTPPAATYQSYETQALQRDAEPWQATPADPYHFPDELMPPERPESAGGGLVREELDDIIAGLDRGEDDSTSEHSMHGEVLGGGNTHYHLFGGNNDLFRGGSAQHDLFLAHQTDNSHTDSGNPFSNEHGGFGSTHFLDNSWTSNFSLTPEEPLLTTTQSHPDPLQAATSLSPVTAVHAHKPSPSTTPPATLENATPVRPRPLARNDQGSASVPSFGREPHFSTIRRASAPPLSALCSPRTPRTPSENAAPRLVTPQRHASTPNRSSPLAGPPIAASDVTGVDRPATPPASTSLPPRLRRSPTKSPTKTSTQDERPAPIYPISRPMANVPKSRAPPRTQGLLDNRMEKAREAKTRKHKKVATKPKRGGPAPAMPALAVEPASPPRLVFSSTNNTRRLMLENDKADRDKAAKAAKTKADNMRLNNPDGNYDLVVVALPPNRPQRTIRPPANRGSVLSLVDKRQAREDEALIKALQSGKGKGKRVADEQVAGENTAPATK
ncbi:hypothetical protein C8R43DRAFT_1140873 [Mycena crocata]|nr:hypothetical protein C8R43DRAFT_1140873 [Mycena crocata]